MNTTENKAKFFAQYWGQNIGVGKDWENQKFTEGLICSDLIDYIYYIRLKPLSSITDEDAKNMKLDICTIRESLDQDWILTLDYVDKLRFNGYALDWNEITVEDQIKYGWIKLIET